MPFKHRSSHRRHATLSSNTPPRDWSRYNAQLKRRGDLTIWLSDDVINQWVETDRVYTGDGAPLYYSEMAILTVHEIRQVFQLPLRQCEGFVNSLFRLLNVDLRCPSFSTLSKRLAKLDIRRPYYRQGHREAEHITGIALDSTGLKCFYHDEWMEEKYRKTQRKKNWRKLHVTVDNHQIIQNGELTLRRVPDTTMVKPLVKSVDDQVRHVSADGAYDNNPTYETLMQHFPAADIVIPPQKNAQYQKDNAFYRNRNILEVQCYGKCAWQKKRGYGQRNRSENSIGRYKRILGSRLHAREFSRQRQEAMIGCSILNKMQCLALADVRPKN